jgi:hypothetical protein
LEEKVFSVKNTFYQRSSEISPAYPIIVVKRSRDIPALFMTYIQPDPFWIRIFEIAASSDVKPRFVKGQNVRFLLTDVDVARAKRLAEELMRVSYDAGAKQVKVTIEQKPLIRPDILK